MIGPSSWSGAPEGFVLPGGTGRTRVCGLRAWLLLATFWAQPSGAEVVTSCLLPLSAPDETASAESQVWPLRKHLLLGTESALYRAKGSEEGVLLAKPAWERITNQAQWPGFAESVTVCDTRAGPFLLPLISRGGELLFVTPDGRIDVVIRNDALMRDDFGIFLYLADTAQGVLAALDDAILRVPRRDLHLWQVGGAPMARPEILATRSRTFLQQKQYCGRERSEDQQSARCDEKDTEVYSLHELTDGDELVALIEATPDRILGATEIEGELVVWDSTSIFRVDDDGELAAIAFPPYSNGPWDHWQVGTNDYFFSSAGVVLIYADKTLQPLGKQAGKRKVGQPYSLHLVNGSVYLVARHGVFALSSVNELDSQIHGQGFTIAPGGGVQIGNALFLKTEAGDFYRFDPQEGLSHVEFAESPALRSNATWLSATDRASEAAGAGSRLYAAAGQALLAVGNAVFRYVDGQWRWIAAPDLGDRAQLRYADGGWPLPELCQRAPPDLAQPDQPGDQSDDGTPVFVQSDKGPFLVAEMPLSEVEPRFAPVLPKRIGPYDNLELRWTLENAPCAAVDGAITQTLLFRGPDDAEPRLLAAEAVDVRHAGADPSSAQPLFTATAPDTFRQGDYRIAVRITDNASGESVELGPRAFSVRWAPGDVLRWVSDQLQQVPWQLWAGAGGIATLLATIFVVRNRERIYRRLRYRWWRLVRDRRAEPGRIFISYRDDDLGPYVARIRQGLDRRFRTRRIAYSDRSYERRESEDFKAKIMGRLRGCDVVVALIGPAWLNATRNGRRRLDDPGDFVRQELALALQEGKEILLVLTKDTPNLSEQKQELPEELRPLADKQTATRLVVDGLEADFDSGLDAYALRIAEMAPTLPPVVRIHKPGKEPSLDPETPA